MLVFAALHIDEIANDEPTDVPQPQLPRNFIGRFQIGLQDCLFDIARTFIATGIHVDGNERFRFINDNVAAALQPNLTMKCIVDLLLHAEGFENWRRAVVKVKAVAGTP